MDEPIRIAATLFEDAYATPAAILVGLIADPQLEVLHEDRGHLRTLRRAGCIALQAPTPLGQRVAMVLRASYGMQAWSHAKALG